jgi:hypothetical protein
MVQRAANRVADDEAFGERSFVVRARRADCKESISRAGQHHVVVANPAEERVANGD